MTSKSILFFLLMICCTTLQSQVSIDLSMPVRLNTMAADTIDIPLKSEGTIKKLKLNSDSALIVLYDKRPEREFNRGIKFFLNASVLRVIADPAIIRKPGVYEAMLEITTSPGTVQKLSVQLERFPVTLDTIRTVMITCLGGDWENDSLMVRETGGKSGIQQFPYPTQLILGTTDYKIANFDSMPPLLPGKITKLPFSINTAMKDKVELGITQGRFEINSPELQSPLIVPFTIIKRKHSLWILLPLGLGLLLGYCVRNILRSKKELEQLKEQGSTLLRTIRNDSEWIKDEQFIKDVTGSIQALYSIVVFDEYPASTTKKTEQLTEEIKKVNENYEKIKTAFTEQLEAVKKEFMKLAKLFEQSDSFTPAVKEIIEPASAMYFTAKRNIAAGKVTAAKDSTDNVQNKLTRLFTQASDKLQSQADLIANMIPAVIMQSMKEYMDNLGQRLATKLTAIAEAAGEADAVKATIAAERFFNDWKLVAGATIASVKKLFVEDYEPDQSPEMIQFHESFNEWENMAKELGQNPYGNIDLAIVQKLNTAWNAVIPLPTQPSSNSMLGGDRERSSSDVDPLPSPSDDIKIDDVKDRWSRPGSWSELTNAQVKSGNRYFWFSILQLLLLLLILCIIFYFTYAPDFIGTNKEMIIIFLFAAGIDVTVDNVMQLAAKNT